MLDIGNIDHLGTGALSLSQRHPFELISKAMEQIASLAQKRELVVATDEASNLPTVSVDQEKITRVLINLIANAIKFSGPEALIEISAKPRNNDGHPCVVFSVKDDGIGIPLEHFERIFSEGFHADKAAPTRKSSGLGLTFCKRVVEVHGGTIWLESDLGKGTTFSFSIPSEMRSLSREA